MPRLKGYVHVVELDADGQQTGRAETFGPGVDLPPWAVDAITNDDVWEGDPPARAARPAEPTIADELATARAEAAAAEAEIARLRELAVAAGIDPDDQPDPGPYDKLTADELREELASRQLPTSGAKPALRERLQVDDEARKSVHEQQ